jgi:hypothetical protein
VHLVLLTLLVFPLSVVPWELQRRLVNAAVDAQGFGLMLTLAGSYVGFIVVNDPLKLVRGYYFVRVAEGGIRCLRFRARSVSDPLLQIGVFATVFGYMLFVESLVGVIAFTFFISSLVLTPFMQ